jgi:UDP-N-acetylglucosamine diphosphorylase/glucosamine-1-phosphate N-acetyltransferase
MSLLVFEDDGWDGFGPISSTRHLSRQVLGARPVLEHFSGRFQGPVLLSGRSYLAGTTREETGLPYNEPPDGPVLALNARLNPLVDLKKLAGTRSDFALLEGGSVALAVLRRKDIEKASAGDGTMTQRKLHAIAKGLSRLEVSDRIMFAYPWEMLELNGRAIESSVPRAQRRGLVVSADVEVEEFVSYDPTAGPIVVEDGARIEAFSRLTGPCHIGPKTVLRSALVRGGTSIGENCRIGGEVESSIVYAHTNKAHSGYVGHAIVGEWVNIGSGSQTSDLKSTYGTVRVARPSGKVETGLQKLGPMIGDMAKVSIGAVIYAGRTVGVSSHVSGLVDRDVPDFSSYDGFKQEFMRLTLESAGETQARMMSRRGERFTKAREALVAHLYRASGDGGAVPESAAGRRKRA